MFSKGLNVKLQKFLVDAPKDRTFKEQANKAIKISNRLYCIQLTSRRGFTLSCSACFNAPCLCALVIVPSYVPLVAA